MRSFANVLLWLSVALLATALPADVVHIREHATSDIAGCVEANTAKCNSGENPLTYGVRDEVGGKAYA
ncbi:hypothetical protein WOLCODRAFT_157895 [Wolfiporia cocos MD-104 SS10]|uniref:Uncharacterized protein n=1 Tax=Wolfiporia cocos (strain MD-104) TaxID=742152 RepID=A0A2H3J4L0_WOLCO|nr:hypothetical protein WOLCODRAFT_157895 [Wolfiporia cocos MD-104 SS10]